MKKLLLLVTLFICLVGCSYTNKTNTVLIKQTNTLPPFKTLVIKGDATVELINGSYATTTICSQKDLRRYKEKIVNQTLYLEAQKNIKLQVLAYELKNIIVNDNSTLLSKNFKTNQLTITANHNGTINLEGQFNIEKIYQHGNGRININWVSSDDLSIASDSKGPIHLAGIANNVTAKLTNCAQLDARYLRAYNASIFTADNATADVLSLTSLDAFAVNKSKISYYKRPKKLTTVTKNSGVVLHPDWIH